MLNIEIRRPRNEDMDELYEFFQIMVKDTYTKEGIGDKLEDLENEILVKKIYLMDDLTTQGEKRFFLLAIYKDKIIGSIAYGPANEIIVGCLHKSTSEVLELGTVFVHPDYQYQGIGNLLLASMFQTMNKKGIKEFWLDSGYKGAQKIWQKKFGEPEIFLKDYWEKDAHHMIWKVTVPDA
ncbi:GNAT family N-acetyltransferase [Robertmurraya yapensis]|uniref:GNAT family N-acetyltransferase n=2 Tax=Bacillaceae TaxID=186817 RepID=A0A3S0KQ97_9BACI|nr:GNAT family N-acetyltransferase [Bacillus yapensis]RTR35819.1 GNAT family N-acetyltransferase [Bacillus yapensis]TKS98621.1 GNAT family N-acetyltransferase [Bacillus yapensis]